MFSKNSEAKIHKAKIHLDDEISNTRTRVGSGYITEQTHTCVVPPVALDDSRGRVPYIPGIPTNIYIGSGSMWQCDCGETYKLIVTKMRAHWEKW